MLREIGWPTYVLVILTIVVVLVVLSQTTAFGPLAGGVGVTSETALTLGQNPPMAEMTPEPAAGMMEATEEPMEMTPEAESTVETGG